MKGAYQSLRTYFCQELMKYDNESYIPFDTDYHVNLSYTNTWQYCIKFSTKVNMVGVKIKKMLINAGCAPAGMGFDKLRHLLPNLKCTQILIT